MFLTSSVHEKQDVIPFVFDSGQFAQEHCDHSTDTNHPHAIHPLRKVGR